MHIPEILQNRAYLLTVIGLATTVAALGPFLGAEFTTQVLAHEALHVAATRIKYRLVDPEKVRLLVEEYGKTSLKKSADNLADIFLSLK